MAGAAVYTTALFVGGGSTPAQGGRTTPQLIIPGGGSGAGVLPQKGPHGSEGSELTTRKPLLQADVREVEGRL